MRRPVRSHASFARDLADQVRWLRARRPLEQITNLRLALKRFRERVADHPMLGQEEFRRGSLSFRVFPIGGRLPYLVWYYFDEADEAGPVWLAMLMHEKQDRERFDPSRFS